MCLCAYFFILNFKKIMSQNGCHVKKTKLSHLVKNLFTFIKYKHSYRKLTIIEIVV